mmetsp:Transcript_35659/g.55493  ORF Transcript_35659/g.55493 Transcript_35659/m.55493 type:complete len:249 (+) Transcript_35659:164-910(+)
MEFSLVHHVRELGSDRKTCLGSLSLFLGSHGIQIIKSIPVIGKLNVRWVCAVVRFYGQRLQKRKRIRGEPVNGQTGGDLKREESNQEGKELQNDSRLFHLFLFFVGHVVVYRRLQDLHRQRLSQYQNDGHDQKGNRRFPSQLRDAVDPPRRQPFQTTIVGGRDGALQGGDPQEWFVQFSVLCQETDSTVEAEKDGKLGQTHKASGQWVLFGIFVEFANCPIFLVFVVLELFLHLLEVRFQGFHVFCRF